MRKIPFVLTLMLLYSCTKGTLDNLNASDATLTPSYKISIDSLKKQATTLGAVFGGVTTKGRVVQANQVIHLNSILAAKGITKTLNYNSVDPQAYVMNFDNDAGFAILIDDQRVDNNVLAYSESGNIDGSIDNPGLLMFIEDAITYVGLMAGNNGLFDFLVDENPGGVYENYIPSRNGDPYDWGSDQGAAFVWRYANSQGVVRYPALLSVNWGQRYPYDQALPAGDGRFYPTGCVATAAVLLMSYYK